MEKTAGLRHPVILYKSLRIFKFSNCSKITNLNISGLKIDNTIISSRSFHFCYLFCTETTRSYDTVMQRTYCLPIIPIVALPVVQLTESAPFYYKSWKLQQCLCWSKFLSWEMSSGVLAFHCKMAQYIFMSDKITKEDKESCNSFELIQYPVCGWVTSYFN